MPNFTQNLKTSRLDITFESTVYAFLPPSGITGRKNFKKISSILWPAMNEMESFLWSKGRSAKGKPSGKSSIVPAIGLDLEKLGFQRASFSLTLCGEKKIRNLNKEYRGKDKVTDVLSFPVHETLRPESPALHSFLGGGPYLLLGDIVICHEKVIRQAKEFGLTWEEEFIHLLVHGFLHLCGFDHEVSPLEEKVMFALEELLVLKILKSSTNTKNTTNTTNRKKQGTKSRNR